MNGSKRTSGLHLRIDHTPGRSAPRGGAGKAGPRVPIVRQGDCVIAFIQSALTEEEMLQLRDDLLEKVVRHRSKEAIVDVTQMDVIDSFAVRTLCRIARTTRLRGAETVIVGLQPEVALAMVRRGSSLGDVATALDVGEAKAGLDRRRRRRATRP